jgi:glycosyltransferase involved in cell wall biosynthesis
LKILLILGNYLPTKNGGIENYTHWLATNLINSGHDVTAAYLNAGESASYIYEGVSVIKLNGYETFAEFLQNEKFDIFHFHEHSGQNGINIQWFTTAKMHGKVFFTFHLPYLTCYKGDFRYLGIEDCDNFSSYERCIKCVIATRLHYKESNGFNLYNEGINLITPIIEKTKQIKRLNESIQLRNKELNNLIETCDNIFIYANWFKNILAENGYSTPTIKKIPYITKTIFAREKNIAEIKNKILFVGRIEQQKGLHLLCKAMNIITTNGIQLDVFGNIIEQEYYNKCESEYQFNFKGTTNRLALLQMLPLYDFLILPSIFPEMYSMIVKDAFYEQLPVIASASKGNRDAINEGLNGFIFKYNSYTDLASVIDEAYTLKAKGWKPDFTLNEQTSNLQEIISYYQ